MKQVKKVKTEEVKENKEEKEYREEGSILSKRKEREKQASLGNSCQCFPWIPEENSNLSLAVTGTPLYGAWKHKCSSTDRAGIVKSVKQNSPQPDPSGAHSASYIIDKADFYQDVLAYCVINVY
jgi:hypothetical protein